MKSILLSLLLAAAWTLSGADLTGKWAGTVDMKQDGEAQTIPVVMIVKQEGNKLTGTAGPEEDQAGRLVDRQLSGHEINGPALAGNVAPFRLVFRNTFPGCCSRCSQRL